MLLFDSCPLLSFITSFQFKNLPVLTIILVLLSQMGMPDEIVQVDALERQLLADLSSSDYNGTCEDEILYDASFGAMEDSFVKYHIARWILLSILLILAWGVGLLMLLYLPIGYMCAGETSAQGSCI